MAGSGGTRAGVADRQLREVLAELGSTTEPAAAGVATALSCSLAASLVELSAELAAVRLAEDNEHPDPEGAARMRSLSSRAGELRARLLEAADEDVVAYAQVARADDAEARDTALAAAADPPLAIAECAAEVAEAAAETAARARPWAFGADAAVAADLAAAAARGAAQLVDANLGSGSDDPRVARARESAERASGALGTAEG